MDQTGGSAAQPARGQKRRSRSAPTALLAVLGGLAATQAPIALTGVDSVDLVQRFIIAAGVAYIGAHGRRWSWLVGGLLAAVFARDIALVLVLAGLAFATASTTRRRRHKELGAISVSLMMNGIFWYPSDLAPVLSHLLPSFAIALVLISGFAQLRRRQRRVAGFTLAGIAVLALVAMGLAAFTAVTVQSDVSEGTAAARQGLAAIRRGDTEGARQDLLRANTLLTSVDQRLDGAMMAPAELVPGAAQQVRAVTVSVAAARRITEVADTLIATDYDDLRYDGQIDLEVVRAFEQRSLVVQDALTTADVELESARRPLLFPPLRERIDAFSAELDGARLDLEFAAEALGVAPSLLGGDGERRYLVVFLTPAELRGAGGFVGNWIELLAIDGDVSISRSGRIEELIDAAPSGTRTIDGPQDYLARYSRYRPEDNLQDITVSPNWPSDASVFSQLYVQSGGTAVDGVFGVDPTGIAALLSMTGPVEVDGLEGRLSEENAVEFLTRDQYQIYPDRDERADVLEESIRATFDALTSSSLPSPRAIGDALGPAARGRHLQLWSTDATENALFDRIDADGRVAIPQGTDGFTLVQQNTGNNKLDAYLQRDVDYQARVNVEDASMTSTLTVTLTNNVPSLDLGPAVVGNGRGVPIGTNLTSLTLHTPHVVTAATVQAFPLSLAPDRELGMYAWDLPLISVPPGESTTVVFELAGTLDLRDGYRFLFLPQPMANPETITTSAEASQGSLGTGAPVTFEATTGEPVTVVAPVSN